MRCDPLTITDAFSRMLLSLQVVSRPNHDHVRPVFDAAFCDFGLRDQYGVTIDGHFKPLPTGKRLYAALDRGDVDVVVGFTTSPQFTNPNYVQLIDDRHMFGLDAVVPISPI